jgi:predicted DNA-binding protein (MmcQ/YjbR family)
MLGRAGLIAHALAQPGAWLDEPWDEGYPVVKVGPRIFLFCGSLDADPPAASMRCQPDDVEVWRSRYPGSIGRAPYMGTKPWNQVRLDGSVPDEDVLGLLEDSYDSVVARLAKRDRPPGRGPGGSRP